MFFEFCGIYEILQSEHQHKENLTDSYSFFYKDGDKSMCNRHPMQLSLNHYWRSISSVPFQFTHSHKLRLGYERHVGVGILSPITRLLW